MIAPLLSAQLEPVARRQRNLRLVWRLAVWWGAMALIGLGLLRWSGATHTSWLIPLILVASAGAAGIWIQTRRWQPNWLGIARTVEEQHPQLHALLQTAVEQQADPATGQFNFLQMRVIAQAGAEARRLPLIDAVSPSRLAAAHLLHALACLALLWVVLAVPAKVTMLTPPVPVVDSVSVTPGNVSIERGHGLAILARFDGSVPAEVSLVMVSADEAPRRVELSKSLDDPVFGGSIEEVKGDMTYHLEYGEKRTTNFLVKVFDYPKLERADALITPPAYTAQPPKRIQDTRRITAVEGSKVDFSFQLNKPVASARLVAKGSADVTLGVSPDKPAVNWEGVILETNLTYELQLIDLEGRTNKIPASLIVNVLKNRPPELKMDFPRGDQKLTPLEELGFEVQVSDDFGLTQAGLTYTLAGQEPRTITLGTNTAPNEKQTLRHLLRLEELGLKADDLVNYYVWADDIGPDGNVRRTSGDMFFAEIRPFDEIFREGQGGGSAAQAAGGQQGQQAERMGESQKEIINATWKLRRREAGQVAPSASYAKDVAVVRDAQKAVLEQVEGVREEARTSKARQLLEKVEKEMKDAVQHLESAVSTTGALPEALTSEQGAYQALLKLQAHEYQVSRSQQNQSQSGGGGQRSQQQLNQLDLKQAENRYETERQAAQQQPNAERQEQVQVISRLKELAQRQQDVKDRLKELQTALQQAETEQEKEEIRRRLKRLREEEQQMLADIDELRERMSKPENQSRMAESREQLEQVRSEVQQAAEALESENVSQALTSATRAERDLGELRDDFRKQHSSQFTEQMREMRSEARQLGERQEEISKRLQEAGQEKRKTLTDDGQNQSLAQTVQQQQEAVTNLVQQMTQVTQEAENVEPLLARQLYESVRKASQGNLDDSLNLTGELVRRGFVQEARRFEGQAQQEIQELKRGVEQAAQSILGDDTEALRMARQEVDRLAEAVQREVAQAQGEARAGNASTNNGTGAGSGTNQMAQAGSGRSSSTNRPGQQGEANEGQPSEQASAASSEAGNPRAEGQGGKPGSSGQTQPGGQQAGQASAQNPGQSPGQATPAGGQTPNQASSESSGQGSGQQPGQGAGGTNGTARTAQSTPGSSTEPSSGGQQQNQSAESAQTGQGGNGQGSANSSTARAGQQSQREQTEATENSREGQGARQGNARGNRNEGQRFFDAAQQRGGEGGGGGSGPLTGAEYTQWSDRMRNVEEMLDEPSLRAEVATVRERVRGMRAEFKRHAQMPQWDLVQAQIVAPLTEIRSRISEELARRESNEALVPIDRDPVPKKFSELVRRYYEKLGQ